MPFILEEHSVASLGHERGWGWPPTKGGSFSPLHPMGWHPASLNNTMQKGYSIFLRPSSKHQAVPSWTTNRSTCMLLFGFIGKHIIHAGIMITQPQKVPSHPHCYIMASWTTKSNLGTLFGFRLISS